MRPMEAGGEVALEFLCQKNECGLFAVASHSKKRPHNVVLGRMFDYHLYDVLEVGVRVTLINSLSLVAAAYASPPAHSVSAKQRLGRRRGGADRRGTWSDTCRQVEDLKTMKEFGSISSLAAAGSKPCMTFMGEGFETQPVRYHALGCIVVGGGERPVTTVRREHAN